MSFPTTVPRQSGGSALDREVILHGLRSIAHEMAVTVANCAISQVVRDSLDFSTAVFDAEGRTVAQGLSIPLHLGAMPEALQAVRSSLRSPVSPGDVFLLNDPDQGGMHLPDVFVFRPVFVPRDDTPLLWLGCVAHHADIGGRFPGGNAVDGTHIFEEGLQLPPMRVVRRGVFDENVRLIIERNVRLPAVVWTDLSAQLAALTQAEARCLDLVQRHGAGRIEGAVAWAVDRTGAYVRSLVASLPDGTWTSTDHIDGDMAALGADLSIVCRLTIDGEVARFDFAGSSTQVGVAINATESFTRAAVFTAFLGVFDAPEMELNQGLYDALDISIPAGTILAGRRPAPRAARGITGFRTVDTVMAVLAQVVPERVMAAGDGGATMISVGMDEPDGSSKVLVDFLCGAWGGRANADGLDGASALGANLANVPIEEIEANFPVRYRRYGFVPDTGGDGRHRGGLASVREFEFLGEEGVLSIRSDRRRHPPYGLMGGAPGAPSTNLLNPDTEPLELATKGTWTLKQGDVLRHVTAGGGGFGLPSERDPTLRAQDLREGKVGDDGGRFHG
jgi:N-methylhydantoinase B